MILKGVAFVPDPTTATVIEQLPLRPLVDLRLYRPTAETLRQLERILGGALPTRPGALITAAMSVLWLAPHEWFIVGATPDRLAAIASACTGTLFHLVEVTDGTCGYRLTGRDVTDLIARGCSLDLHPTVFPVGHAAKSLLDGVVVLLHRIAPGEFHLYCDSSLEAYLIEWFRIAAEEITVELRTSESGDRLLFPPMQTSGESVAWAPAR